MRLPVKKLLTIAALIASSSVGLSCGGDARPADAPKKTERVPNWADVFDGTPDLYVVVRPRAMKRDGVYGQFFKSLLRAAQARGIARGATMVQAVDGADEIVLGLDKGLDAAIVIRGVPASIDPQRVTDGDGRPLFRLTNERTKVLEFALEGKNEAGALFVLPDRTWVGALGSARERARQAFATPFGRPAPQTDADALVVVRVAGDLAHALDRHPLYGVLSDRLSSATFSLKPGKDGLVVALKYEEPGATALAEMHAKRIIEERSKDAKWSWLKDAHVAYEGNTVVIRVAVPARLLEELPNASGADLGL